MGKKKTTTRPPHPPTRRRAGGPLKLKRPHLKKGFKKPQKVLFKIKSLDYNPPATLPPFGRAPRTKKVKRKKPAKPAKPLVKKPKVIKAVKPKKPKLVKPIEPKIYQPRIKVIGIGGGGSSIVSEIASEVKRVNFVVANTDWQALQTATRRAKHFQFGRKLTQDLGTGMDSALGEMAAREEKEKIKELLKGTDFCILVSCLGGGTGSGASPIFAEISRELRNVTLGIFTLPFNFEGEKRTEVAKSSLEKLKQNLNALIVIPNQKIFQIIDKDTPLKEALSTINKALVESLEGLITLIYSPGLIKVDFADLKTILAGRGRLAYLNSTETKNPNQIEELAKRVLSNPLSPYSAQGAKEILFNIDGGLNLNMSQVEQIGKTISDSINPKARVAFGITQNKKDYYPASTLPAKGRAPRIKITLLANGCKWKEWEKEKTTTLPPPSRKRAPKPERKLSKLPKVPQSEAPQTLVKEEPKEVREPEKITPILKDCNSPLAGSHPSLRSGRAPIKIKVRQNALEIRRALQEEEEKMLAQERKWETPAFLRRNFSSQTNEEVE